VAEATCHKHRTAHRHSIERCTAGWGTPRRLRATAISLPTPIHVYLYARASCAYVHVQVLCLFPILQVGAPTLWPQPAAAAAAAAAAAV